MTEMMESTCKTIIININFLMLHKDYISGMISVFRKLKQWTRKSIDL